ncbi:ankyrin repeat domain-containing protein [Brevibacillus choshinensis]|uniref:Ankyrin repeat domain-containing protein n=1 Tax=Brevibacillus choshinensis TaxID=54911 RepID=A0ABX7FXB3_BRECH|nr:ankyrin repeat domain-containing protein [Brevibacillus choshinensis]QRG70440.1 ankyrin repeat domain-containing protein [Brevibacillus choshinensis]
MNVDTMLNSDEQQATQSVNMEIRKQNQALLEAAKQGDKNAINQLLADGADINATDETGRTSALIAVHTNQLDIFNLLIEHGANLNIRDERLDNPLLYASAAGKLEFVKASIAAGADTTVTNRFGGTALIPAADRGHVAIVEELLTHSDVNIDHINRLGWTALLEAVILGDGGEVHQQIVNLLIEHGANVNLADHDGVTPLQHAKSRGYQEMADALTRAGAK